MFEKIIWATDGSDAADDALPVAMELAGQAGNELIAVHANELMRGRLSGISALADEDELQAKIAAQVETLRSEGLDASFEVPTGMGKRAAELVADVAETSGADLIVVGTHGHSALAGVLLGSVTQQLLRIAPCPVLAVNARKDARVAAREPAATAS